MKSTTRQEAKTQGLKRYSTGRPCRKGHLAERYTAGGHCAECSRELKLTPEYKRANRVLQARYSADPVKRERLNEYQRTRNATPEGRKVNRVRNLRNNYGITPEQFAVVLAVQGNRCGTCHTDKPGGRGHWKVDHDHVTENVRGVLCNRCNLMLGNARDNLDTLRRAIRYLEESASIPGGRFAAVLEMFS